MNLVLYAIIGVVLVKVVYNIVLFELYFFVYLHSYQSEFSSRKVKPEDTPSSVNSPTDSFSTFGKTIHR